MLIPAHVVMQINWGDVLRVKQRYRHWIGAG